MIKIVICLISGEFRTVPKIPRFGDFEGQSLEFPLTQIPISLIKIPDLGNDIIKGDFVCTNIKKNKANLKEYF